jgi:hypothetical protein
MTNLFSFFFFFFSYLYDDDQYRFKYYDRKYIRPALLRERHVAEPKILDTFSKLKMRDAKSYAELNASASTADIQAMASMFKHLHPRYKINWPLSLFLLIITTRRHGERISQLLAPDELWAVVAPSSIFMAVLAVNCCCNRTFPPFRTCWLWIAGIRCRVIVATAYLVAHCSMTRRNLLVVRLLITRKKGHAPFV